MPVTATNPFSNKNLFSTSTNSVAQPEKKEEEEEEKLEEDIKEQVQASNKGS